MARTYVDIVVEEEKEITKTVDEVTILFEEKDTIVNTVVKEAEEAIINSNNKDKEVFDGQTIEVKEQLAKDAKVLTETLATLKQTQEKQAFNDERSATVAKETAAEKQIEYNLAKQNKLKLEAQAKASKAAETEKKQELEEAKTATKLALGLIPSDETSPDYTNRKETWTIQTAKEVEKTTEVATSTRDRQNIEKDVETAKSTETSTKNDVTIAVKQT